ncbi:chromatin-remodeling complex subunit ies6 [Blastocladiella emersonii ATCC 22665]|nr:chromatin-remodeling complex subunit ies6 [Blastocladiella emersonii ATCC 22665]
MAKQKSGASAAASRASTRRAPKRSAEAPTPAAPAAPPAARPRRASTRRAAAAAPEPEAVAEEEEIDELAGEEDADADGEGSSALPLPTDNVEPEPEPESPTAAAPLLDVLSAPKPFKVHGFATRMKKYKTLKQMVATQAQIATAAAEAARKAQRARDGVVEAMEVDESPAPPTGKGGKRARSPPPPVVNPLWTTIRAAPSVRVQRKYCDITGLPAPYTDPATGLHYYNAEVYQHIKALPSNAVQSCLTLRTRCIATAVARRGFSSSSVAAYNGGGSGGGASRYPALRPRPAGGATSGPGAGTGGSRPAGGNYFATPGPGPRPPRPTMGGPAQPRPSHFGGGPAQPPRPAPPTTDSAPPRRMPAPPSGPLKNDFLFAALSRGVPASSPIPVFHVDAEGKDAGLADLRVIFGGTDRTQYDVVQVATRPDPNTGRPLSVVKLVSRAAQYAKQKQKKAAAPEQTEKEVQVSAAAAANDVAVKVNRAREFLAKGFKVKIVVQQKGGKGAPRKEEVIDKVLAALADATASVAKPPAAAGSKIMATIVGKKVVSAEEEAVGKGGKKGGKAVAAAPPAPEKVEEESKQE